MATRNPLPWPDPQPLSPGDDYDQAVADSFPASDPPAGVIKVGPRKPQLTPVSPPPAQSEAAE